MTRFGYPGFAGATQFVTPEDVAGSIPCGPDLDASVEAAGPPLEKLRASAPAAEPLV